MAGKNADWSVLKRFTVAAGEKVSLFAQKLGIKIFAAKGPVEFQAQSGPISLIADKDVNAASVNGKVSLSAAKEIILECVGAFVQIKDGSITLGGPGDLFLKTITVQKQGKTSMHIPMSALPLSPDERLFSNRVDLSGAGFAFATAGLDHPWANLPYVVTNRTGTQLDAGQLDQTATGPRSFSRRATDAHAWVGTPGWDAEEETLLHNGNEGETA